MKTPFVIPERKRLRILLDPAKIVVNQNGCHIWIGACSGRGYGAITIKVDGRKRTLALHKITLEAKLGRKLEPSEQALHECDTPNCINEDHLFPGTQLDNMRDKLAKGRHPTRYKTRMLSDSEVATIRARYEPYRVSQYQLAKEFGISRSVVEGIIHGTKYKDT